MFYLPEPPADFQPLRDFRLLPAKEFDSASPELRFEIRRVLDRREIALDLYEMIEGEIPSFTLRARTSEEPDGIASRIRNALGVSYRSQVSWRDNREALAQWRTALENFGVLVFQAPGIDLSEMRGFSISETPLPVIVVNSQDAYAGRIFTMMHELAHILLRAGGICDLTERPGRPPEEQRIEIFCNRIAGAVMVPRQNLIAEDMLRQKAKHARWEDDDIQYLARRYCVSREAMLRRLLTCGYTSESFYKKKRREYLKDYELTARRKQAGAPPFHRLIISRIGRPFARLVLNSYEQERITASEVSDYLEVNLKHIGKIAEEVLV